MGPLGKACSNKDIHKLPVADFEPVEISESLPELSEEVLADLSRDQQLLYRYAKAIVAGSVEQELLSQIVGPINHARWLTLAIRLLVLYTRTDKPSDGLLKIVKYIL